MSDRTRAAHVEDVHRLAMAMPHVTVMGGTKENPVYQVAANPSSSSGTLDPTRSTRTAASATATSSSSGLQTSAEKQALVQDESTPFFSTSHFDGHPSVLVRASRLAELSLAELQEIVQDAWLARASRHRAEQWLSSHPT